MAQRSTTRRDFLAAGAAFGVTGLVSRDAWAQRRMPQRPVPSTGEMLPVIGLGSSKVVEQIAVNGPGPLAAVLRALVEHGGKVVDTWPRNADNDAAFGRVVNEPDLREKLFIASKIDRAGKESGIAQYRQTQLLYGREPLDLLQVFSLTDVDTHWPSLKEWKAAGEVRYIGVTVANAQLYDRLEAFLRREQPDFVQMNYSLTERESEDRMLPFAADRGVAVIINRPFMNGAYFDRLAGRALPSWAAEFECTTWAQFSLKYILANPRLTCVLTETADPKHMAENALTALGPLPDEAARARMREFIAGV
jgi:diketogulonate reductase-like aldo/keto reductase